MLRVIVPLLALAACQAGTTPNHDQTTDTAIPTPKETTKKKSIPTGTVLDAQLMTTDVTAHSASMEVQLDEPGRPTLTCQLDDAPALWKQLVPFRARWSWLAADQLPNTTWIDPAFDASSWATADMPIGYTDAVVTDIGIQKSNLWLRATFDIDDPAAVEELTALYRRDDGIVIWLNGTPVHRDNAPSGAIDATSQALESVSGSSEERALHSAALSTTSLRAGENVLAVALLDRSYSDASFDLRLTARIDEPADPAERHVVTASRSRRAHAFTVHGLLSDATYTCTATAQDATSPPVTVTTGSPTIPPPPFARAPGSATGRGYTLVNVQKPCLKEWDNWLYILDEQGRIRWEYDTLITEESSIDIEALLVDPEHVLFGGGDQLNGKPKIVHLDHTVVHEAAYPGVDDSDYHHDVAFDGSGIIGLKKSDVIGKKRTARGFSLVTYDPDSQAVTWEWDAQRALDDGALPDPGDERNPYHANALSVVDDTDGRAVYVGMKNAEWVMRIDRNTGETTWRLGRGGDFTLVDPKGDPLPDSDWFDVTHGMTAYAPNRVWVYHNGRAGEQSEAIAMSLDTTNMTATVDWRWTEYGWYEPIWGDVDELPNGNAVITMAHAWCYGGSDDHLSAIVELDPSALEVVWRVDFLDPNDATYRSQRIDGCDIFANEAYCPSN